VFVTGTDTGIGKTVVSAALLHRYRASRRLRYWKPVQTGIEQDDDTAEVAWLGGCSPDEIEREGIRLPCPVSPHLAARRRGVSIRVEPLVERLQTSPPGHAIAWIVEGAGGVLVPLNEAQTNADLIAALSLPALVVARSTLGTINHTLLTLEALRRRSIEVAGVVIVGMPQNENRLAIESYGGVAVLGEMPPFPELEAGHLQRRTAPDVLARWAELDLDSEGRLLPWLE
jgi:dethiobiotin synthase